MEEIKHRETREVTNDKMYRDEYSVVMRLGSRGAGLKPSKAMACVWQMHTHDTHSHSHTHTHTHKHVSHRTALARNPVFHDFVKKYCTDVFFSFLIICPCSDFEGG